MKMHPVGDKLLHAEEQTDGQTGRHDESNKSLFAIFWNASKMYKV